MSAVRAVLFDLGGVLTDSPMDAFAAYEATAGLPAGLIRRLNATDPDTNAWAVPEHHEVEARVDHHDERRRPLRARALAERALQHRQLVLGVRRQQLHPPARTGAADPHREARPSGHRLRSMVSPSASGRSTVSQRGSRTSASLRPAIARSSSDRGSSTCPPRSVLSSSTTPLARMRG